MYKLQQLFLILDLFCDVTLGDWPLDPITIKLKYIKIRESDLDKLTGEIATRANYLRAILIPPKKE